jgi:hypothetical protein
MVGIELTDGSYQNENNLLEFDSRNPFQTDCSQTS